MSDVMNQRRKSWKRKRQNGTIKIAFLQLTLGHQSKFEQGETLGWKGGGGGGGKIRKKFTNIWGFRQLFPQVYVRPFLPTPDHALLT